MRLTIAALCSLALAAGAAEESAAEIARKSRQRAALNLVDLTATLKLTTVEKSGKSREQILTTSAKKVGDRNRSIARFSSPPSVAGVAVLTVAGAQGGRSEVSLYLPKLRRVRRVASSQRAQSFMETDLDYADLGGLGAADDAVKRLADQKVEGREAYLLSGPAGSESPYGEIAVYVDKQSYVPLRIDYTDKKGSPYKRYLTIKLTEWRGRTLAAVSTMENVQSGSKTTIELIQLRDSNLGDEAFTERALERG